MENLSLTLLTPSSKRHTKTVSQKKDIFPYIDQKETSASQFLSHGGLELLVVIHKKQKKTKKTNKKRPNHAIIHLDSSLLD